MNNSAILNSNPVARRSYATRMPRKEPGRSNPIRWTLPGFSAGARVQTSFGDLPIEALRRRDPLRTVKGTIATVERVDCIRLDEGFLGANSDAQPVHIPAGAFGHGRPERDLLLSPHQLLSTPRHHAASDFKRARDLIGQPGILRRPETQLSYYVFHCSVPVTVSIEGLTFLISP